MDALTWKERTLIRILFIIALIVTEDEGLAKEVRALATHISVSRPMIEVE